MTYQDQSTERRILGDRFLWRDGPKGWGWYCDERRWFLTGAQANEIARRDRAVEGANEWSSIPPAEMQRLRTQSGDQVPRGRPEDSVPQQADATTANLWRHPLAFTCVLGAAVALVLLLTPGHPSPSCGPGKPGCSSTGAIGRAFERDPHDTLLLLDLTVLVAAPALLRVVLLLRSRSGRHPQTSSEGSVAPRAWSALLAAALLLVMGVGYAVGARGVYRTFRPHLTTQTSTAPQTPAGGFLPLQVKSGLRRYPPTISLAVDNVSSLGVIIHNPNHGDAALGVHIRVAYETPTGASEGPSHTYMIPSILPDQDAYFGSFAGPGDAANAVVTVDGIERTFPVHTTPGRLIVSDVATRSYPDGGWRTVANLHSTFASDIQGAVVYAVYMDSNGNIVGGSEHGNFTNDGMTNGELTPDLVNVPANGSTSIDLAHSWRGAALPSGVRTLVFASAPLWGPLGLDTSSAPEAPPPTTVAAVPTLGKVWATYQQGYGLVRPSTIFNGGDPTGAVRNVQWQSWGGSQATGHGLGWYVPPDRDVAGGQSEAATVVAFDLGSCRGTLAYRAIEWYFPQHGETFDPSQQTDICPPG
jgi:hypothetical protein